MLSKSPKLSSLRAMGELKMQSSLGQLSYLSNASGIVFQAGKLFLLSDDENSIGVIDPFPAERGKWFEVLPEILPTDESQRKKTKPDWESMVRVPAGAISSHSALLLMPSGSTKNRTKGALLPLNEEGQILHSEVQILDLSSFFFALIKRVPELNIEGLAIRNESVLLFQRGNGVKSFNSIITVEAKSFFASIVEKEPFLESAISSVQKIDLGEREKIPLNFTDACSLSNGNILFTAAAEDSQSTYHDGEVKGSVVGLLLKDNSISLLGEIPAPTKIEGITVLQESASAIEILLVSDPDKRSEPSQLYQGRILLE